MAWANVNTSTFYNSGAATTVPSPATSLTTGNPIVVQIRAGGGSVSSVADTALNTYTQAWAVPTVPFSTSECFEVWYCLNPTGNASNVVTATLSASQSFRGMITSQWSCSGTPVLSAACGVASSLATITALKSLTLADAVVIGCANGGGFAWTAGSGMTTVATDASNVQLVEAAYLTTSASVTVAASNTGGAGSWKQMVAIAFSVPGGGGGGGGTGGSFTFIG